MNIFFYHFHQKKLKKNTITNYILYIIHILLIKMSNTAILDKYLSTPLSLITLKEIQEDFMEIKPTNVPIYDILLMNTLGTYINKFSICSKWKYYENIHIEIIKMLIKEYPLLGVNYNEIIQEISILRENLEPIYKVEFKTLEIIDKQYRYQYNINKNYIQNTTNEQMLYLQFKFNINSNINKLLETYKQDFNEINTITQNLIDSITENFSQLETNTDFITSLNFIENVKDKINEKVENMIKDIFHSEKYNLNEINSNEINSNETSREELKDIFYMELDKIYKNIIKTEFSLLNQDFLDKIEKIFDVEKEMNKLSFSFENFSQHFKNSSELV